ncbi:MAG: serine/threonine-protein kinase [Enhygromyxa sp.]
MTPERWREVEELFNALVELPAAERSAQLACVDDPTLRAELESLLAALDDAPARLQQVIAQEAEQLAHESEAPGVGPGQRLGPYRVLETIGEGGMGTVVLAERDDGEYRTRVAIKLLRGRAGAELASPEAVARFRDERQILALLEHPNIVRLLDGGHGELGPYLVMEHVDGVPLTRYAKQRQLSLAARLELFLQVAAAVAYAHQHLVVHRDLKPSNILVTADGTPKLLDFGIAKLLAEAGSREAATRTGMRPFTPEYASPEQLRGEPLTTSTDIYSLGAVLYELCTDCKLRALPGEGGDELRLRAMLEEQPRRPSTVAPAAWRRALRGDLDSIVLAALHRQPKRRYASVEQLIDDLERHLGGLPVKARDATVLYRVGKFVGRNALAVVAGTIVVGSLLGATLVSLEQARRADAQAREAEQLRQLAATQAELAQDEAALARARALALRDAMRIGAARHALRAGDDPTVSVLLLRELESPPEASFGWLSAVPHFTQPAFVSAQLLVGSEQSRTALWSPDGERLATAGEGAAVQLWSADGAPLVSFGSHDDRAGGLAWSPDQTLLAVLARGSVPGIWRRDGTLLARLEDPRVSKDAIEARWSPDGEALVTFGDDKSAKLWAVDGTLRATLEGHSATVSWAMWSPAGRLVTASRWNDPRARIWTAEGELERVLAGHEQGIHAAVWSPDGQWLVTASEDATARVVRVASGEAVVLAAHHEPIFAAAWSPDGQQLALASRDGQVSLWQRDGTRLAMLAGHRGAVVDLQWSPGGQWIASASEDASARVWRADGTLVGTLIGHPDGLVSVSWRPHSRGADASLADETLLTSSYEGPARTWQADLGLPITLAGHSKEIRGGAWSPDGSRIATASEDRSARVWALDGTTLAVLDGHEGAVQRVAWSPEGARLLTLADDQSVRLWQADGRAIARLGGAEDSEPLAAAWGPEIAIAYADGSVKLWRDDGQLHATLSGHEHAVRSVDWSSEGLLLTGSWDATARIWRRDGTLLTSLSGHEQALQAAVFSPDGSRVATTSMDRSARIWRIDGSLVAQLAGLRILEAAAFSPDGSRLVTTGMDHAAQLWTAEGAALARLAGHTSDITALEWNRQGTHILTASTDTSARLWSADGLPLATLEHEYPVTSASFNHDGTYVLTTSDIHAKIWRVDPGQLRRGFWLSTPRCLSADERQRMLAESPAEAEAGEASCRAMQACLRDSTGRAVRERFDACFAGRGQ